MQDFTIIISWFSLTINAKHGDNTKETRVHQLFRDFVVTHYIPQRFGYVLATCSCLLSNHHLNDVLVLVHVESFNLPVDLVRYFFGPFTGLRSGIGLVWKSIEINQSL